MATDNMKIIVPYANNVSDPEIHYCVKLNFELLGIDPEWIRMDEPNSYSLLINRLWQENEKFIIVEHDVIPWRGAIESIWDCPEPFCGYDGTLQCAKIIPQGECPVNPRTGWPMMDAELHRNLYSRGIPFHDHVFLTGEMKIPVTNLNRSNIPRR